MKLICAPKGHASLSANGRTGVLLFSRASTELQGIVGAQVYEIVRRLHLSPPTHVWDFLAIALSIIAADHGCSRKTSPDGWTRILDLEIAVNDSAFWNSQSDLLEKMIGFLTTDVWRFRFIDGGLRPPSPDKTKCHDRHSVVLLSGGLDSLIGTIDLIEGNDLPFAVSQTVASDSPNQRLFAYELGLKDYHIQFNHCVKMPFPETPPSDRARSIIFMAYGLLLASCNLTYSLGGKVDLVVPENGLISLNPPLTTGRLGSLSTRTTHPYFLRLLGMLLANAGLRINIVTPYQFKTKGEMLRECRNQPAIMRLGHESTSCGRFARYGRKHCGKCLPCLIRRAAFLEWGNPDPTHYVFSNLSIHESEPRRFDDVRSAAIAIMRIEKEGLEAWLGGAINAHHLDGVQRYKDIIEKGMAELGRFLRHAGVL